MKGYCEGYYSEYYIHLKDSESDSSGDNTLHKCWGNAFVKAQQALVAINMGYALDKSSVFAYVVRSLHCVDGTSSPS